MWHDNININWPEGVYECNAIIISEELVSFCHNYKRVDDNWSSVMLKAIETIFSHYSNQSFSLPNTVSLDFLLWNWLSSASSAREAAELKLI